MLVRCVCLGVAGQRCSPLEWRVDVVIECRPYRRICRSTSTRGIVFGCCLAHEGETVAENPLRFQGRMGRARWGERHPGSARLHPVLSTESAKNK